jgi:hypothetical protein
VLNYVASIFARGDTKGDPETHVSVRKIDQDHTRFREIVRGKIKQDLKKLRQPRAS